MRRTRRWARVAVLTAALPLSGCAAMLGGYDTAPNGLPQAEDELRRELAHQPEEAYTAVIEGERELPDDDLLRLLYAGTAGRYAGAHAEGAHLLDIAGYLAEDRVTTRISQQALSLITSDRALDYTPSPTERLMIPYLAAATYLEAGDTDGAAVEARRIEALLDRMARREGQDAPVAPTSTRTGGEPSGRLASNEPRASDIQASGTGASGIEAGDAAADGSLSPADRRFFHSLAGALFEAAGDRESAEVSYRRAGHADSLAWAEAHGPTRQDSAGEVVVLVETGYVPHRVEQSVVIVLPPWQLELLTDGSAGEKAVVATAAAARILLAAAHVYGDRSGYYHDHGYRHGVRLEPWDTGDCYEWHDDDDKCSGDLGAPYLLRISWPVLFQEASAAVPLRARAGEVGADPEARLDVASAARRDFEAERPTMLARTVVRAASKVALSAAAQGAVEKKDEVAGQLVGLLTNIGTLLSERADTRSWHLLPGSVSMLRLRLPAGSHEVSLELDHAHGGPRTLDLGTVDVRPGRTSFVTHRLWR